MFRSLAIGLLIFIAGCAQATANGPTTAPAPTAAPMHASARAHSKPFVISPVIDKSNVTFNLLSDRAREVQLVGEWNGWQPYTLGRNTQGIWSLNVNPLPAGIWSYFFLVDGMEINDPMNQVIQPTRELNASLVQVTDSPLAPWDPQDVPHGVLHTHQYFSTALGFERQLIVYTPPGYNASTPPLPVLYLTQGLGGTEQSWTIQGKAHWITDALIAQKKAVPMIIVMPNAHALAYDGQHFGQYVAPNTDIFICEMQQDIRPLIESNYNVRTDGDSRAFVGLSMGGAQAIQIGLTHPDEYTWIGALSPSKPPMQRIQAALDSGQSVSSKLHLFWMPVGDRESPGETKHYADKLTAAGLKPEFEVVQGDHSWPVWRHDLVRLLPRLFRQQIASP